MTQIGTSIEKAASLLASGELVSIPTETVYGLAANAFDPLAVAKIYEVKKRPTFNPLIVHSASSNRALSLSSELSDLAMSFAQAFWPGPLTMVLPASDKIPAIVRAGLPTVALRVPSHPLSLELLDMLDFPLAAPSANPSGYISPTSALHVKEQLGDSLKYILDGGSSMVGIESTILLIEGEQYTVLRLGGLSLQEISEVAKKPPQRIKSRAKKPSAPGMLLKHYAPRTRFVLVEDWKAIDRDLLKGRVGAMVFSSKITTLPSNRQIVLSPHGQIREAAARLFAAMHELDAMNLDLIFAEKMPEIGLGPAINDRLERASAS